MESVYLIIYLVIEMASTWIIEIEKFNGTNFELWKLKVEDILVDHDLWVFVSSNKPSSMKKEDQVLIDRKAKELIMLCLADSFLLNVHEEKTTHSL